MIFEFNKGSEIIRESEIIEEENKITNDLEIIKESDSHTNSKYFDLK
jgi:hypothetical protein